MTGRSISGTMGLGHAQVSGLRREPSPPAMMIAFTIQNLRQECIHIVAGGDG
jgi:hypothetical protein